MEKKRTFWSRDYILTQLVRARIAEEKDYLQNLANKSKSHPITKEFKEHFERNPVDALFGKEGIAFHGRQTGTLGEILDYVAGTRKDREEHGGPSEENDLLKNLEDWEPGSFAFETHHEDDDEDKPLEGISLIGPISFYITEKADVLAKLYSVLVKDYWGFLTEDSPPNASYSLSASQRSKLELLRRQFEAGAAKYPGISSMVMSWPFMQLMPRPPKNKLPDFKFHKMRETMPFSSIMFPRPLMTAKTMTKTWLRSGEKTGLTRFKLLASEAGEVAGDIMFEGIRPRKSGFGEYGGRVWGPDLLESAVSIWLQAMHLFRNTLTSSDGWDGLFDEDSDISEIPVTLREFMDTFCTPKLQKNFRDSRVRALQSAARRKEITLPKHEGEWDRGRSKKYSPVALVKEWPSYRNRLSNLPELKPAFRPS